MMNPPIRPFTRSTSRGFSLVELMLVMGLIGLVLGAGLGLLTGLQPGGRAVSGLVEETVRLAHRSAVVHGGPATVICTPGEDKISAQVMRTVGTWHFEDAELSGGAQLNGIWMGGGETPLVPSGFQGSGLDLTGASGAGQMQVSVREDGAFDWSLGFSIQFALRVDTWRAAILLRMGDGLILALSSGGAMGAEFRAQTTGETGKTARGPRVRVETEAGLFTPGEWRQVNVQYDQRSLRIIVDGVERVRRPEVAPVWLGPPQIWISAPDAPFPGTLDRLVIAVQEEMPVRVLPGEALFHPETPGRLQFAPGGALDVLVHSAPPTVRWLLPDGTEETITVGLQGTVQ